MVESGLQGFKGYGDPLELVDRTDMAYEDRLALLQEWQAALAAADAPEEQRKELAGAIQALETGAVVQDDDPEGAPENHGYGAKDS